jgi:NADP-dependent 3-hydroxy acid dehydrogenase YdfG
VGAGKCALARALAREHPGAVCLVSPSELPTETEAVAAAGRSATPVVVLSARNAQRLRRRLPATYVFVSPASLAELEANLRGRGARGGGQEQEEEHSDEADEGHRDDEATTPADAEDEGERLERLLSLARRELAAVVESPQDFDYVLAAPSSSSSNTTTTVADAVRQLARMARRAARGLGAERRGADGQPLQILGPGGVEVQEEEGGEEAAAQAPAPAPATAAAAAAAAAGGPTTPPPPAAPPHPFISPELAALRGKVAIVTGASSGIGRACARQLHAAGMRVAAVARRADRLAALGRELEGGEEGGGSNPRFLALAADVSSEEQVAALLPAVRACWGDTAGADVLVHVAGLARDDASIFDGAADAWRQMSEVNLIGTCLIFREVVRDMERRKQWGHVVSLTGLTSIRCPDPQAGGAFFAGTKMAMRMCTEGLRREARERGVPLRVSAVSPGLVDTEFFAVRATAGRSGGGSEDASAAAKGAAARDKVMSSLPGEPLSADDVSRCVLFCLSAPAHMEVNDVVVRPRAQAV